MYVKQKSGMKNWLKLAAMYRWFGRLPGYGTGLQVCCKYRSAKVRLADHLDGYTTQL